MRNQQRAQSKALVDTLALDSRYDWLRLKRGQQESGSHREANVNETQLNRPHRTHTAHNPILAYKHGWQFLRCLLGGRSSCSPEMCGCCGTECRSDGPPAVTLRSRVLRFRPLAVWLFVAQTCRGHQTPYAFQMSQT
ncbi:hypothetical protein ROHU_008600 [Labeo rohita]|uniref:Uncharacterized protein n=1 Tax=Labeo rohita TaxID=84645 RepID=A0A498M4V3_LABRO|nr:hypothetical protein ROHU_008600 [Labeo rohita]